MCLPSKTRQLSLLALLTLSGLSYADDQSPDQSPWLVRFRFLDIGTQQSNNTSTAGEKFGITPDSVQVSGQTQPEIDLSYFFTNHISAELVGSFPVSHTVSLSNAPIGSYLGLKLETVSRALSRFHDQGLLFVKGRHIQILDAVGLHARIPHR